MNSILTVNTNSTSAGPKFTTCSNCNKRIDDGDNKMKMSTVQVENCFTDELSEILIWDAVSDIYGISWEDFDEHLKNSKRGVNPDFSNIWTSDSVVMCPNCASLLSENYNSQKRFGWATSSKSIIQLVKNVCRTAKNPSRRSGIEERENSDQFMPSSLANNGEEDSNKNCCEDGSINNLLIEIKEEPILYYSDIDPLEDNDTIPQSSITSSTKTLSIGLTRISSETFRHYNIRSANVDFSGIEEVKHEIEVRNVHLASNDHIYGLYDEDDGDGFNVPPFHFTKAPLQDESEESESSEDEDDGKYNCNVGAKRFRFPSYLEKHLRIHEPGYVPKPRKKYQTISCPLCDKILSSRSLPRHMKLLHREVVKAPCVICEKLILPQSMREHMKRHSGGIEFKCDKCQKVYSRKFLLDTHIQSHDPNIVPYICKTCGKTFTNKCTFELHEKRHTNHLTFVCELCTRKFSDKLSLRLHQVSHTSEKPSVCEECGKCYKTKKELHKHVNTHRVEVENGEYSAKCHECEAVFKNQYRLEKHFRYNHSKKRKFPCSFCGKNLASIATLVHHENLHKTNPDYQPRKEQEWKKRPSSINTSSKCTRSD